ncbi:MAG: hypothetical protein IPL23_21155 [Saprospiraceae bacterium]|nr:hypothetical protein [Saprospiraceae bacterium]
MVVRYLEHHQWFNWMHGIGKMLLYKSDVAMVLRMPSLLNSGVRVGQRGQRNDEDRLAMGLKKVEDIKAFFREAKAYLTTEKPSQTNLKFESLEVCLAANKNYLCIAVL